MIAIGVDLSVSKVAIGGIFDTGRIAERALAIDESLKGAQRLVSVRRVAQAVLGAYEANGVAVLVEEPPNPTLRQMAAVVLEVAQATIPGAVVMAVGPTTWKRESLGHGHAPKPACLAFARALGYEGVDQDVAEALCMADAAWGRWNRDARRAA